MQEVKRNNKQSREQLNKNITSEIMIVSIRIKNIQTKDKKKKCRKELNKEKMKLKKYLSMFVYVLKKLNFGI